MSSIMLEMKLEAIAESMERMATSFARIANVMENNAKTHQSAMDLVAKNDLVFSKNHFPLPEDLIETKD